MPTSGRSRVDQFRRWFEYEKDSHAKTLASLQEVPLPSRSSPHYQKALDLCAHLIAARRMWLFRFGEIGRGPAELFPTGVALEELRPLLDEIHTAWTAYLDRLTEAELERVFEYRSYDGPRFRNSVEDILTQLFGHSWYHRGQIALLVRLSGAQPAVTDFVFWTREPLEPAQGAPA